MTLTVGCKVFIYWNFNKKCWSVKMLEGPNKGKVGFHANAWEIGNAVFKVSEAGRQRVLRERRKNVHAGVMGTLRYVERRLEDSRQRGLMSESMRFTTVCSVPLPSLENSVPVGYNPYYGPYFYVRGLATEVHAAQLAWATNTTTPMRAGPFDLSTLDPAGQLG